MNKGDMSDKAINKAIFMIEEVIKEIEDYIGS